MGKGLIHRLGRIISLPGGSRLLRVIAGWPPYAVPAEGDSPEPWGSRQVLVPSAREQQGEQGAKGDSGAGLLPTWRRTVSHKQEDQSRSEKGHLGLLRIQITGSQWWDRAKGPSTASHSPFPGPCWGFSAALQPRSGAWRAAEPLSASEVRAPAWGQFRTGNLQYAPLSLIYWKGLAFFLSISTNILAEEEERSWHMNE